MDKQVIVVGLDESKSARQALRWAASYAERTGSDLRAVHALSWPLGVVDPAEPGYRSADQIEENYRASISRVFASTHTPASRPRSPATACSGPSSPRSSGRGSCAGSPS